jgi:malonyl-CoA/methylmalonyl-CoA synthetase
VFAPTDLPLFARALEHGGRTAIADGARTHGYAELLADSAQVASALLEGRDDLEGARVALLLEPGYAFAAVLWGIWRAGGVAVPLGLGHPLPEWAHVLADSAAAAVVVGGEESGRLAGVDGLKALAAERRAAWFTAAELLGADWSMLPDVDPDRRALIVYTSGTTGRPKGVVLTHRHLEAQVCSLADAWGWTKDDRILHALPLHHVHGLVNALCCPLWTGAACELMGAFDARAVWERWARGGISVFMGVPTMYAKLAAAHAEASPSDQDRVRDGARRLRLMVSGSAALSPELFERWSALTGQPLLERYGMTEIGMALSNPLHGERVPGSVGTPLPGVEVRLVGDDGQAVGAGEVGELWVRGPGVFHEYWGQPEATRAAFRAGGWFATGDAAACTDGDYRILGRRSCDILKTGGFKVAAREVEDVLRSHEQVADAAVVGLDDAEWGQRVAAALVPRRGGELDPEAVAVFARAQLAAYKVPTRWLVVGELPRNSLGKVLKPQVAALFAP